MRLKQQLEHYLTQNNMNATHLSRRANVPRQTLANWLMGSTPKNLDQVKRVADLFNITLDHLIYGEPKEKAVSDEFINRRFEVRIIRELSDGSEK